MEGIRVGNEAACAHLQAVLTRMGEERVQRFSTWPAMLPGPSKKDCDELDESTWSVSGV